MDKGAWKVFYSAEGTEISVCSDDFVRDVCLKVSGDFSSPDEEFEYCEWLASVLNKASAELERSNG